MDTHELAKQLYREWASRNDLIHPLTDEESERFSMRRRWEALEPPDQDVWLRVAGVALKVVVPA